MTRLLLSLLWVAGCGDDPFEFAVSAQDHSAGEVEIWVDGERITDGGQTIALVDRTYDSYAAALDDALQIETRQGGAVLATCALHPGACRDRCTPARVTASVCVFDDGRIQLNTWDCPCDDEIEDWFCGGDCAMTAPSR